MTDRPDDRGTRRLDLRSLDAAEHRGRDEAVIQAVLARLTTQPDRERWVMMYRMQRALAAAAAVWLLAAGILLLTDRHAGTGTEFTALVETWARSSHVPTNGELLAAYKGYRR